MQINAFQQNNATYKFNNNSHSDISHVGDMSIKNLYTYCNQKNTQDTQQTENSINLEKLKDAWHRYMRSISSVNSSLYNVMNTEIAISNNHCITLNVKDSYQADQIGNAVELKRFLRNELKNTLIDIVPNVIAEDKPAQISFSNEEKLKKLISENGIIDSFIKELDLTIKRSI